MINNIDGVLPEHELYFARFKFDPLLESTKLFKVEIVRKLTYSSLSAGLILDKEKLIKVWRLSLSNSYESTFFYSGSRNHPVD